jgi:putative ABC transport system permease protein
MLKNYSKIAVRNILRAKINSLINIIGMAVSISACILISLWIHDELRYDKFNKNADRIYRVYLKARMDNRETNAAISPAPMGEDLHRTIPEVEAYTRLWGYGGNPVIKIGDKVFYEDKFIYADSTFFNVFSVEFILGKKSTSLTQPNSVVLTNKTAKKYFGNNNPIGKVISYDKDTYYTVTGVVKEFPEESHFHFDLLGSLCSRNNSRSTEWINNNFYTYLLLKKGTDVNSLQTKINSEVNKYLAPEVKAMFGFTLEQFEAAGNRFQYKLQPVEDIHLYSHLDFEMEPNNDISYIYIFSAIALSILLIACINFINLSTARSEKRAKEVGIRKTLGSYRYQVAGQFFLESILTSAVSVAISVMMVEFLMPLFNKVAGKHMEFNLISSWYIIPFIIGLAVLVGVIAGIYPALYLSSFEPAQVLKSELRKGSRKSRLRSGLVIFQFAISIILIIGTVSVYKQLKYMQSMNLGFNKDQIVIINHANNLDNQLPSFENELLTNRDIVGVSNSRAIPGLTLEKSTFSLSGRSTESSIIVEHFNADNQFQNIYDIKIKTGRYFSREHPSDSSAVIVNESAAKIFGIKNIDGKYLVSTWDKTNYPIIGIMKDFNFASLHEKVRPLVIFPFKQDEYGNYLSVRIKPGDYLSTLSFIKNTWKKYSNNETPDYKFLDQDIQKMYLADQRTGKIATIFSVLAIVIACLGLFGLATFISEQRTKEIGIRKVLGATIPEIVARMSREFIKWVVVANVIAWPVAYYFMSKWLQNFAYKTNISLWAFILSGTAVLLIALLTISSIAIKAATANPIKSLKYE